MPVEVADTVPVLSVLPKTVKIGLESICAV